MAEIHCRHFNGYKPCDKSATCDSTCAHFEEVRQQVVVVHLGALGAVLRSTALLRSIHEKFPKSFLTWVTQSPAHRLLENNPLIDRVLTTSPEDLLQLKSIEADVVFCIDKSLTAAGITRSIHYKEIRGFKASPINGAILPANDEARELWDLGLNNHKKFFENQKPETQLVHEALRLGPFTRDEYQYHFTDLEKEIVRNRRDLWAPKRETLIGINTGCSGVIPYKKWTVEYQRSLIQKVYQNFSAIQVVLLGGKEDERRNAEIARGLNVISSPTDRGLRDGMMSVAACDLVISGDSLGMHMAIAQKKWVVAWFGPTCSQEIDLYDRGRKVLTKLECSPCWKRNCDNKPMCYDMVDSEDVLLGIKEGLEWLNSSFRQHILATSSSASQL